MNQKPILLMLVIIFIFMNTSCSQGEPCDEPEIDPQTLKHDQVTVIINGYSEHRIPLLISISNSYSSSPVVAAVLILWGNPSTDPKTLSNLSRTLPPGATLIPQPDRSLNRRFLPRPEIRTAAVLICDDDVEVDSQTVSFAFRVWGSHKDRLVGLFARSHDLDLERKQWIYTVHPDRYSIVLTKFVVMATRLLKEYSCGGGEGRRRAREVVERESNCEDILMNFVSGKGPLLVGGRRVRDWGDSRNDGGGQGVAAGLSSRREGHRRRRGDCIREFHSLTGVMSLRFSFGKVVHSVGEQGLCRKRGKLVFCDKN